MNIWTDNYLTRGFWGDEAWTALISSFNLTEIIRVTAEDFHPPLYYFLVHGFIQLFGASEWIRLISVVFYLLMSWPVYLLIKKLIGKSTALITTVVILANPILFTYAFEARSYAMLALIGASSGLFFWKGIEEKNKKWWIVYWILGSIGVYTHYYFWFVLMSHGFYWLWQDRKQVKAVVSSFLGILLIQLPWIPKLVSQIGTATKSYWIGAIDKRTHWEFFVRIAGGDYDSGQQVFTAVIVLVFLILSGLIMKLKKSAWPKGYKFLWSWFLVPVIVPTLISLVYRPVFFYRYLIFSAIPILMIVFWGARQFRGWLIYGLGGFLLALYMTINWFSFSRYPQTMREELNNLFNEHKSVSKLVTVLPSFAEVMFYGQDRAEVQVLPEGLVQFSGKSLLDAFVRKGKVEIREPEQGEKYWLLEPGPKVTFISNGKQ